MVKCNMHVKCDVRNCEHNCDGRNCSLDSVKITCGNSACTRCGDFKDNGII